MKYLYKYPQQRYPYEELENVNREKNVLDLEYELEDTGEILLHINFVAGIFSQGYWDVFVTYAKGSPNDILMEIEVTNRGEKTDTVHVLPTLWYRNTWTWGCTHEGCGLKPKLYMLGEDGADEQISHCLIHGWHESLGDYTWAIDKSSDPAQVLFTENETNSLRLFGVENYTPYVKDAFHRFLINGEKSAVSPSNRGTKACAHCEVTVAPHCSKIIRTRLWQNDSLAPDNSDIFGDIFTKILMERRKEADGFYNNILSPSLTTDEKLVSRQALAGLLWTKQFYHYIVQDWLGGDKNQPEPPESRKSGRNADWKHLYNRDVISMPDKWEYPWYASWDLAFHAVALALVDMEFAKDQLVLFLREWYMHPNGQIPAYEFALGDVNPPVHAWAVMNVYRGHAKQKSPDFVFLAKCFQKLSLNFTWWVNRKDPHGRNLFGGGFLGLDNIGVFDRSKPMPVPGQLEQVRNCIPE
ncbi:hypothetical protein SK128_016826 [Halocaridina rubra]|uniref:Mannosylglycerate hydrolase MGH1-like glycoside hydrolase domain-containing protein n=1 Tax=Halocaridina rubra TaxID=373956 RepID=A0AAN9A9P4_HALRR